MQKGDAPRSLAESFQGDLEASPARLKKMTEVHRTRPQPIEVRGGGFEEEEEEKGRPAVLTLRPRVDGFWIVLGSCWDRFGIMLG